jgi:hypothetical protein
VHVTFVGVNGQMAGSELLLAAPGATSHVFATGAVDAFDVQVSLSCSWLVMQAKRCR